MKYKIFKEINIVGEDLLYYCIKKKTLIGWSKNVFKNKGIPRTCYCKTLEEAETLLKIIE